MRQPEAEARRWLAQAESDLAFAEVGVREGFFAHGCFICQQAGEKAFNEARLAEAAFTSSQANGSSTRAPLTLKSEVFRVTTVKP
jgi:hypothetical protein